MKVSKSLSSLLAFLRKKEAKQIEFNAEDILEATQWKPSTFSTYLNKGQLSDFISETRKGVFQAANCQYITDIEFAKLFSQSKHRRGLGHNCSSKLAKALLRKSKDNILLAIELYNRPSLENRMDVFVICFCTAWEQFLKALIIQNDGEHSIFKPSSRKGIKETIPLRACIENNLSSKFMY